MTRRPVVVGVDGSDASLGAFAHGAWQAQRRGKPLRLVFCQHPAPGLGLLGLGPGVGLAEELSTAAADLLADLAEQARLAYPGLAVITEVVPAPAGATLVAASREAALVVVGSRGLGGFAGLLLGSVGTQLSAHSACPVIVMRPADGENDLGAPPAPKPVVVGVDGVPDSDAALEFAFAEAAARGAPVIALYAWWMLPVSQLGPSDPRQYRPPWPESDRAAVDEEARRMLAEATVGVRERYPGVPVTLQPAHAMNPVMVLLEASADAGLLVVSRHGGNAFTRLIFSSVGDIAVREASCPVAVVPEHSTTD